MVLLCQFPSAISPFISCLPLRPRHFGAWGFKLASLRAQIITDGVQDKDEYETHALAYLANDHKEHLQHLEWLTHADL